MDTRRLIKEAAKRVFFSQGNIRASTDDIARKAGVNRALIHYYFRKSDHLYQVIITEAIAELRKSLIATLLSDELLIKKAQTIFSLFSMELNAFPFLTNYVIAELIERPELKKNIQLGELKRILKKIDSQIQDEVLAGSMRPVKAEHFLMNLFALACYPSMANPVLKVFFRLNEKRYRQFLHEHQEHPQGVIHYLLRRGDLKFKMAFFHRLVTF